MQRTPKTDADVEKITSYIKKYYLNSQDITEIEFISADSKHHADGYSFTFTEPRSADKDYTINNEEELVGTIDDIVDGWQPNTELIKVQR